MAQVLERFVEYEGGFTHSPQMRAVGEIIAQIADTNAPVLIRGESGVGKDHVARIIHSASRRHEGPFIKLNCATIPPESVESELFGHERGASPGASRRKPGMLEFASEGTLFLDEIAELPASLRTKLVRVLQDLRFSRIGGQDAIRIDVRLIASTRPNPEVTLGGGKFREDLGRLTVVEIRIPPLRDRKGEISFLTSSFLARFNRQYQRNVKLSPPIITLFRAHPWPGNVRELEEVVRRLVVTGNHRQILEEIQARLPVSSVGLNY